jgi:hypothetical protein
VLVGRYDGQGSKAVHLKGMLGSEEVHYVYEASFGNGKGHAFLPQLWAVRRVGFLLGEVRKHGQNAELVDEIKRLGVRYGIVTPYTSFLVVDERELTRRRLRGFDMPGGAADPQAPEARKALEETLRRLDAEEADEAEAKGALDQRAVAGRGAVGASSRGLALKKAKLPSDASGRGVKRVGGKTFRFRDGIWVDLDTPTDQAAERKVVRVTYLSDEYMKLLDNDELARWLSVGADVTVLVGDTLYEIRSK